jgi:Ca2+-binding EF-hand superfamily protein
MDYTLSKSVTEDLKRVYQEHAKAEVGGLPTYKLQEALKAAGIRVDATELKRLLQEADPQNKGTISVDGFLQTVSKKMREGLTRDDLLEAFRAFDSTNTGFVTTADLIDVMQGLHDSLGMNKDDIVQLIKEADFDNDGRIDYREFIGMLFEIDNLQ